MKYSEKIILTDVDGVLLNWIDSFERWMIRHGYEVKEASRYCLGEYFGIPIKEVLEHIAVFNESAEMGKLGPFRDALKYVRKLHKEHGYVFHCITAICPDVAVREARRKNLEQLFGKESIERLECVGLQGSKYMILSEYSDSGLPWIEDHASNAEIGHDLGLNAIIMDHGYNRDSKYENKLKRVSNWKEIYDLLR